MLCYLIEISWFNSCEIKHKFGGGGGGGVGWCKSEGKWEQSSKSRNSKVMASEL